MMTIKADITDTLFYDRAKALLGKGWVSKQDAAKIWGVSPSTAGYTLHALVDNDLAEKRGPYGPYKVTALLMWLERYRK